MLAKALKEDGVPREGNLFFEPKWDGFRCVVFRDGDNIELGSRNEKPLTRYFPELVEKLKKALPPRCVVDGEIVLVVNDKLDFNELQSRIHPAQSRIKMLSEQSPVSYVAFDALAVGDEDLRSQPMKQRREALENIGTSPEHDFFVTPVTVDPDIAENWFQVTEGAGLDGLVAKPFGLTYQENKRVMLKLKHKRTADCVVAGYRMHKDDKGVGSLLLGLFDEDKKLHHVGVASSFSAKRRAELLDELGELRDQAEGDHPWADWARPAEGTQRMPGSQSRWSARKDFSFQPLRIELVAEVAYDHMEGDRFRHATTLLRWRPDRDVSSCNYDQLEVAEASSFSDIFEAVD